MFLRFSKKRYWLGKIRGFTYITELIRSESLERSRETSVTCASGRAAARLHSSSLAIVLRWVAGTLTGRSLRLSSPFESSLLIRRIRSLDSILTEFISVPAFTALKRQAGLISESHPPN